MLTAAEARACIEQRRCYTVAPDSGCWIADAELRAPGTGYGPFLAFYVATFGDVPPGFEVVHRCQGGPDGCVRPTHLDLIPAGARVHRELRHVPLPQDAQAGWARAMRSEREARTMSREDFARELGVSPSTVRSWEQGTRTPGQDTAAHVARRLGWGEGPRKWVVTLVVQEVVIASTAGDAVTAARARLEREDRPLKSAVFKVQLAGARRRRPRRRERSQSL